ncbi:hypothetical protein FIBSPDRAFT_1037281 [Athelia psychrophila]|uniref:Uncharacterized protein n=1 Tax=Athelia psychrophila TaxID=1759441 RepID=A0A166UIA4_9AGAM|nr:hypothetical protein FIBSPDRAFT_1037281 [Fibularhizoctonia sp. CBS 109695]
MVLHLNVAAKRKADDTAGGHPASGPKKAKAASQLQQPAPPLRRVIIPPIEHGTSQRKFTYHGAGLLKHAVPFSRSISSSFPPLTPVLTKVGKVAKRQPVPTKQSSNWWKAQCAFRGLLQTGKISDMQERLRPAQDADMTDELRALETQLDVDFRLKNAEAHETAWGGLDSDQQKAEHDSERFLQERYFGEATASVAVVVSHGRISHRAMKETAEKLGLVCECYEPGGDGPGKDIAVGSTRASRQRRGHQAKACTAYRGRVDARGAWDVFGIWIIDCPCAQQEWGDGGRDGCQLTIAFEPVKTGFRMWASFDFVVFKGVFRFGKPGDSAVSKVRPSSGNSRWDFRWRGSETGEGQLRIAFEHQRGRVVFDKSDGTKLTGVFEGGLVGRTDFTGRKVSTSADSGNAVDDLKAEWAACSEEAHEHANVDRWH